MNEQHRSIHSHLEKLCDYLPELQATVNPPINMFTTIETPTRIKSETTLSDVTNYLTIQSTEAASPSSLQASTPSNTSSLKNSFLKKLVADKEENPLPTIDRSALLTPEEVVEKYPKLLTPSKIPTLAVRLSKEAYFGKEIMALCTVRGTGTYHALPDKELAQLKTFLYEQCHPRFTSTRVEFENMWRACIESVGQSCKGLRKPK